RCASTAGSCGRTASGSTSTTGATTESNPSRCRWPQQRRAQRPREPLTVLVDVPSAIPPQQRVHLWGTQGEQDICRVFDGDVLTQPTGVFESFRESAGVLGRRLRVVRGETTHI